MSEQEPAPEVEAAPMTNGSGPPEKTGGQAVTEEKDVEGEGGKTEASEKGSSGEQKDDNAKAVLAENLEKQRDVSVKAADAEDGNTEEPEDANKVENNSEKVAEEKEVKDVESVVTIESVKDVESVVTSESVKDVELEGTKVSVKDVKMVEVEDVKMPESEDAKMEESEDVKMVEAEAVKEDQGIEEGEEEKEAEKEEQIAEEERESAEAEKKYGEGDQAKGVKRKRGRARKVSEEGDTKGKRGVITKAEEVLNTPVTSSIDRPVRERRTVERLVEVIEKEPSREFLVEKGRGTPLKDIPNVSYKIARKKPGELKLLHQTLFGRRGKAINFKSHILQFSGFVWHENEEKQRAKLKEKLDKYVKDALVDLCDLFDIPVAKATTRKEDLVVKLLDFMAAPYATNDVILAEKEQQSRKRRRVAKGSVSRSSSVTPVRRSRKAKNDEIPKDKGRPADETEDEDDVDEEDDTENGVPDKDDDAPKHSESEADESVSEDAEEDENNEDDDDDDSGRSKRDLKKSPKLGGSPGTPKSKTWTSPKKANASPTPKKSPAKTSSSKASKVEDSDHAGAKVFSRKKKNEIVPSKKSTTIADAKSSGKKVSKGKAKSETGKDSGPSKKELREAICEILKEVDFNTATFTDILKQLAGRYNTDLTSRKKTIKLMIQDELTKLADEAEENEDEEDDEGDAEKDDNPGPKSKEVEA